MKPAELTVEVNIDTSKIQKKLRIIARHFNALAKDLLEEEMSEVSAEVHCNTFVSDKFDIDEEINRILDSVKVYQQILDRR